MHGLLDEIEGAPPDGFEGEVLAGVGGTSRDDENGDRRFGHDLSDGLQASQPRHLDVHGGDVRLETADLLHRLQAGLRFSHHRNVAVLLEERAELFATDGGVVDDEDADSLHRSFSGKAPNRL